MPGTDRLCVVTAASPPPAERSPTALTVRGLHKAFGPKVAVAGIDLDIPHGCFFGLVGPNGSRCGATVPSE
jgi:ABC-2 type transport system ATP-binding protein